MTTTLPSAWISHGAQPLTEQNFDFMTCRLLQPQYAGTFAGVMIDVGRFYNGAFRLEWFAELVARSRFRAFLSLHRLIETFISRGIPTAIYTGCTSDNPWLGYARRMQFEENLYKAMGLFDDFAGNPLFSVCIDGMAGARPGSVQGLQAALLMVRGHNVMPEHYGLPGSVCDGKPSLTTAAVAGRNYEAFEALPNPETHAVFVSNTQYIGNPLAPSIEGVAIPTTANLVPRWRAAGHPIYVSEPDILNGLPAYWAATTEEPIEGSE